MWISYENYDFNIDLIKPCPICLSKDVQCDMGYDMDASNNMDGDRDTYGYLKCNKCGFEVKYGNYTFEGTRNDIVENGLAERWNAMANKRKEKE